MNFTIVCLTYKRPEALKQLLSYYCKSPIHLIIADGSTLRFEPPKVLNSKNSNFSYTYLHIPSVSIHDRIATAVKLITSKYCCLIDDSDLILHTGIIKTIDFLENNSDYSCVSGDVVYAYHDKIFNKTNFIPCGYWSSPLELEGNSCDRLHKMITNGRSANLFYSTIKTEHLTEFPALISNIDYDFSGTYELLWTAFLCLSGKYKKLDHPYLVRTGGDSYPEPIKATNEFTDYRIPANSIKTCVEKLSHYFPNHNKEPIYKFYEIHSRRLNLKYKNESRFSHHFPKISKYIYGIKFSWLGSLLRLIKRYTLHLISKSNLWANSLPNYYPKKELTTEQVEDLKRANKILNLYRKN
jgi:glycosyltransferase domain-containing protein